MVTAVTVTAFAGEWSRMTGVKKLDSRERNGTLRSYAYTQTFVCLYANNCSPIPHFNRQIL